jgi:hypothetical protein
MPGPFEKAGNVIKGMAALVALFPGAAIIFGLVDIPPTLIDLVKVISFSVSLIVLIAVFLLRARIVAMSNDRAAIIAVVAVLIGAASLTFYYQFANAHTVNIGTEDDPDRHIVPLNPSAEIHAQVDLFGGDYGEALRMGPEPETLKLLMRRESATSVIVMIVLLVLSQVFLIAPVVGAAWKLVGAPAMGDEDYKS